jgi:outer membrane protein assembly factor BamB
VRFVTIDDVKWLAAALLSFLSALGGCNVLANPGAIAEQDQAVSRLTPWELNATLAELAGTDRLDLVKDRLARGADPNAPGKDSVTPLQAAAKGGRAQIVELLLRAGADPNLVPPQSHEWSPLCLAAAGSLPGFAQATRMLLKTGARPNDRCDRGNGPTPLTRAMERRNAETIGVLVEAGAKAAADDFVIASWEFEVPSGISRGPFLFENVVVIGASNGEIHALDATSGRLLWTFSTSGTVTGAPSVLDGVLYLGAGGAASNTGIGEVYALELHSGHLVWSRSFGVTTGNLFSGGPLLLIQSGDGELVSVDRHSGQTLWQAALGSGAARVRPVVIGRTIVAATGEGNLRGIDAETGQEKWQLNVNQSDPRSVRFVEHMLKTLPAGKERDSIRSTPEGGLYAFGTAVCEGLAAGGTPQQMDDNLAQFYGPEFARALTQAALAEICPEGTDPKQIAADAKAAEPSLRGEVGVVTAPVADSAGNVFVQVRTITKERIVVGMDAQSGARVFSAPLGGSETNTTVIGGSSLFLREGNKLLALDLATTERRWSLDLQSQAWPNSTMLFHAGYLLIEGDTIIGVNASTGAIRWRAGSRLQRATLLGVADGAAYCRAHDNYYGVDPRTGAVLWVTSQRDDLGGIRTNDTASGNDMFFHAHGKYLFGVRTADRTHARR